MRTADSILIGQMLIEEGIITPEQLEAGLNEQKKTFDFICTALAPFAVKAIKEACPFPPFPRFLERGEEEFKINLSYE